MPFRLLHKPLAQVLPLHWLVTPTVLLAFTTAIFIFIHSDTNIAMLYSQCHSRARLPAVSHIPLLGPPLCSIISFFRYAIDSSLRALAIMGSILSFVSALLTVALVEAARVVNRPSHVISHPTPTWLVFNLLAGALMWQAVIVPGFLKRSRDEYQANAKGAGTGDHARNLGSKADLFAVTISVAIGFVLPSVAMLVSNHPAAIGVWLFFPVWVSAIKRAVKLIVGSFLPGEEPAGLHLASHKLSMTFVWALPVLASVLSHGFLLWNMTSRDDRKEMTKSAIKFLEIDMVFLGVTVLYWIFAESGWKPSLVLVGGTLLLGPGAGLSAAWITRERVLDHNDRGSEDVEQSVDEEAQPDEATPLLRE